MKVIKCEIDEDLRFPEFRISQNQVSVMPALGPTTSKLLEQGLKWWCRSHFSSHQQLGGISL